jgi:hypothetical protein
MYIIHSVRYRNIIPEIHKLASEQAKMLSEDIHTRGSKNELDNPDNVLTRQVGHLRNSNNAHCEHDSGYSAEH